MTLIWWLIYEAGAFIMSLIWRHLRCAYVRGRGTGSPRGHLQCPKALPVRYHRVWLRSWLGSLPTWTSSVPPVFCQHLSISFKATPPVANDLHLTPLLLPPNDAAGWQPSLPHHWRKLIHTIPVPNTSFTFQILPSVLYLATTVHAGKSILLPLMPALGHVLPPSTTHMAILRSLTILIAISSTSHF